MFGVLALLRPQQWIKNLLVFAAPLFAGLITDPAVLSRTIVAFVAMSLVSSGAYVYNDLRDAESDRRHPQKMNRPIASGAVSARVAVGLFLGLTAAGIAVGFVAGELVAAVAALYAGLMILYSEFFRQHAPVDVLVIAAGFLIRAIAGAAAAQVPASPWFLALAILLAMMLGFGKRRSELALLGEQAGAARESLDVYSPALLDQLLSTLAASIVVLYAIYAVSISRRVGSGDMILTWPLVLIGVIRYLQVSHQSDQPPDELLVSDRVILTVALLFAVVTAVVLHYQTRLLPPVSF